MTDSRFDLIRLLEAILFASAEPLTQSELARRLPEGTEVPTLIEELRALYANRGINLVQSAERWSFRTAPDLSSRLRIETTVPRRLSRAAIETLAIVAYHQPVTRAEIEEIRGVALSRGTLDVLMETGWVHPKGRRRTPGRPVTWRTTEKFLDHFGLGALDDLPGIEELKAAGLLDARPALSTLGASALAARMPRPDLDTEIDETEDEEGLVQAALAELPAEEPALADGEEDAAGTGSAEPAEFPESDGEVQSPEARRSSQAGPASGPEDPGGL